MKSISYVRERIDDQRHKAPVREHAPGTAIAPFASRGIVGQATLETIVYDAETTHGGSGVPVLDMQGNVVAVSGLITSRIVRVWHKAEVRRLRVSGRLIAA